MNNKSNKTKQEMQQEIAALLADAVRADSDTTSEEHTGPAEASFAYREKVRTEVRRITDQFSDAIKSTLKPFGIDAVQVNVSFAVPSNAKEVFEQLAQAHITLNNGKSLRPISQRGKSAKPFWGLRGFSRFVKQN